MNLSCPPITIHNILLHLIFLGKFLQYLLYKNIGSFVKSYRKKNDGNFHHFLGLRDNGAG